MLKKDRPDVIHFNSPMAYCFTSLKKEIESIKLLYTCHSEPTKYFFDEEKVSLKELIKTNNLQFIALHEDMREELNTVFSKNDTVVIRNGVEFERFRKSHVDKELMRESLGIEKDAYVAGHIGRFSKVKNHMFLL